MVVDGRSVGDVLELLHDGSDVLHLAGKPPVTQYEWAVRNIAGLPEPRRVERIPLASYQRPSRVPPHAVLNTGRATAMGIERINWHRLAERVVAKPELGR